MTYIGRYLPLVVVGLFAAFVGTMLAMSHHHANKPALMMPKTCHSDGILPDPNCTPGVVADADSKVVCKRGYAKAHRPPVSVTEPEKRKALRQYDYKDKALSHYEYDHLISLELGGSNDVRNLWPEPHAWSFKKDAIENRVHHEVCVTHTLSLTEAQNRIALDWRTVR